MISTSWDWVKRSFPINILYSLVGDSWVYLTLLPCIFLVHLSVQMKPETGTRCSHTDALYSIKILPLTRIAQP